MLERVAQWLFVGEYDNGAGKWSVVDCALKLQSPFDETYFGGFHAIGMPPSRIGSRRDQKDYGFPFLPFLISFGDEFWQLSAIRGIYKVGVAPFAL